MASSRVLYSSMVLLVLLFSFSEAREILVGGKPDAWKIPSSESDSLNRWAQSARFKIGDFLVWQYEAGKDSVLQVTEVDYNSCNTSEPISEHKDGNTKVELNRSGPFYFISGAQGHCEKGQKLIVVVLSERDQKKKGVSPAHYPVEVNIPAPAPSPTNGGDDGLKGSLLGALVVVVMGSLVGMVWF